MSARTLPFTNEKKVTLRQGGGGRAMRTLIEDVFIKGFAERPFLGIGLAAMDDGAAIPIGDQWLIVSTDSHVIQPPFFAGGDIGRLAISGTVNDLAMMGATNILGLTCGIVLEEGFAMRSVELIHMSMLQACLEAGTTVITGDTKVMGRGELDGVVINTTGVALTRHVVRDCGLRIGDRIIVTGTVGDQGLAIMAQRHGLELEGSLKSDVMPLNDLIRVVLEGAPGAITAMKDPTRGGASSALHEMASKSNVGILIDERSVPVSDAVRAAADLLGIDPLNVANEGKALIGVAPEAAAQVLEILRRHPKGRDAAIIATCTDERTGSVILDTGFGRRLLTEPEGEPLPRIC